MRRWWLPVVLALVAAVSAVMAVREPPLPAVTGDSDEGPPTTPAAPLLSARRAPLLLAQTIADLRLEQQLDATLSDPAYAGARDATCLVVRHGDRTVYERRKDMQLVPASNLKILTGMAVLARIDPEERLRTEAKAQAPPANGVVNGNLWVVGGGDPLLETADYAGTRRYQPHAHTPYEGLADAIVAAGVRTITGGVVGDESRFDAQRYVPTWKPGYVSDAEVGPASALLVNDGFARFRPPPERAAPSPAQHAAALLIDLLKARGVAVGGPPGQGVAPPNAPTVAALPSLPMKDIVGEMLRESDNTTAELLVKELGRRVAGEPTTAAGVKAIRDTLAAANLPVSQLAAVDGSGLDRTNRATCSLLLLAVTTAGPSGPLAAGLPVAAKDGTLFDRFKGNPAAGRLRAKTGSLDGVAALSGFVDGAPGARGDPLAFALVANALPRDALGRLLQERVGAVLARYPDAPKPDELAP